MTGNLRITSVAASAERSEATATPTTAPPVKQQPLPPHTKARAELVRTYASILGVQAVQSDIVDTLALEAAGSGQIDLNALKKALIAAGLSAEQTQVPALLNNVLPAIAQMSGDEFVLVLGIDGTDLILFDAASPDNKAYVPQSEFQPYFTGVVLRAEQTLAKIATKHVKATKKTHWFWDAFLPYQRQFSEVVLGSFVANILAVAVSLFSLQVYDRVIPHQSQSTLWVLAAGAVIALVMESALKMARARLIDGAGRQIELGVQRHLLDRLLGMRSDAPNRSPSTLFAAMRDFGSIREFFTASTVGTLADIPFVFIFVALIYFIGGPVVGVLIVGGILMVLPSIVMRGRMTETTQEIQGASAKSSRLLQEIITELDTVKTQRAEERFRRVWDELAGITAIKNSDQRKQSSVLTFWAQGVQQATYIMAVVTCTYLVFAGDLTVGSIIAVGILTSRTLSPLTQLAMTLSRWSNVKTALDSLDMIERAPQDHDADRTYLRRAATEGQFELREVQFRYGADTAAIVDIPAVIFQPGEAVAVLGSNGAGKSTLLRLLSGLYTPTRGTIMLDGTDMGQIAPQDLRRLIGYLGQDVRLFSGTLRDNLNLNLLETDDDRLYQSLDFAGLGQFVKQHPKGLDLPIFDGGQGLSIGQRQSIGWARLWLQDPKVCLLDEPTAALDQTLEATLISRLETWLEGRTAIIATHRVPILSLTKRTMIMQNGRLAVDGPRDAVLAHLRAPKTGA